MLFLKKVRRLLTVGYSWFYALGKILEKYVKYKRKRQTKSYQEIST